jgi:hypothetical protein
MAMFSSDAADHILPRIESVLRGAEVAYGHFAVAGRRPGTDRERD